MQFNTLIQTLMFMLCIYKIYIKSLHLDELNNISLDLSQTKSDE